MAGTSVLQGFQGITPSKFPTVRWIGDETGQLILLDQTRLPREIVELACHDLATVHEAIRSLRVRGAPAIGIAAAFGVCVAARAALKGSLEGLRETALAAADNLATSRPTAVNLFWALDRMRGICQGRCSSAAELARQLLAEAQSIQQEDLDACQEIGRLGQSLINDGDGILTHCNAGALATSDFGTALAPLFAAAQVGKRIQVFADETRPLLQGARLTSWELMQRHIPVTLLCDSAAGLVMRSGKIQKVIVGADRIAANGDTANKIGTYTVALLAAAHQIPMYVAAPSSTFDLSLPHGDQIPIEQRSPLEVTRGFGVDTAPEGVAVFNPAFDVTPARLIRAIITERGLIEPVNAETIQKVLAAPARFASSQTHSSPPPISGRS